MMILSAICSLHGEKIKHNLGKIHLNPNKREFNRFNHQK
jgi:hypothetical protein